MTEDQEAFQARLAAWGSQILEEKTRLKRELAVTNKLLEEREKVLRAIPACPLHGECVPHALEWIAEAKEKLSSLPEVVQISRDDLLRAMVQYMKMQRDDMNNSSSVKLPGQDEVLDKLRAIKCERTEG